jgi:hypothetical protein
MLQAKRNIILIIIGVFLIAASVLVRIYVSKQVDTKMNTMVTLKPTRLLTSGDIIDESMIRAVTISQASHNKEAILDIKNLLGKKIIVPLAENEEIFNWKISDLDLVPKIGEHYFSFKSDPLMNNNNMVRRGDRLDVWVEFDSPKKIKTVEGKLWDVGAVKIIENLLVSSVKNPDGIEVFENINYFSTDNLNTILNPRGKPNGKPDMNTYIMTDDVYNSYVIGSIGGKIKLALPNLNTNTNENTKITSGFVDINNQGGFSKTISTLSVDGALQVNDVVGSEAKSDNTKVTQDVKTISPTPVPKIAEVK